MPHSSPWSPLSQPFPGSHTPHPTSPARRGRTLAPLLEPVPPRHFNPLDVSAAKRAGNREEPPSSPHLTPTPPRPGPHLRRPRGDSETNRWWARVGDRLPPDSRIFGKVSGTLVLPQDSFLRLGASAGCPSFLALAAKSFSLSPAPLRTSDLQSPTFSSRLQASSAAESDPRRGREGRELVWG